jgi:hypothetical protein
MVTPSWLNDPATPSSAAVKIAVDHEVADVERLHVVSQVDGFEVATDSRWRRWLSVLS